MDFTHPEFVGALVGALIGTLGAWVVARWSLRSERKAAAQEKIQALADEARFDAHIMRHRDEHRWDFAPSALERQAFDAALPVLHVVLAKNLRDRVRELRSQVLIMIYVETMLAESATKTDEATTLLLSKRQDLMTTLPDDLDDLAHGVEAAIRTRRTPLPASQQPRPDQPTSSGVR